MYRLSGWAGHFNIGLNLNNLYFNAATFHISFSQHSPRHVCREAHSGECPDGLVSEIKRIERRPVNHIRDHLIAHEDVLQEVREDEVRLTESLL